MYWYIFPYFYKAKLPDLYNSDYQIVITIYVVTMMNITLEISL